MPPSPSRISNCRRSLHHPRVEVTHQKCASLSDRSVNIRHGDEADASLGNLLVHVERGIYAIRCVFLCQLVAIDEYEKSIVSVGCYGVNGSG